MAYKPPPRHVVLVRYSVENDVYITECKLCGEVGRYHSWTQANRSMAAHLKSTP